MPDSVANQIAAGEVIQRPASVIKELVENAIDAGASLIQVWVVNAGKTNIQVVDNGCGLSETDARLAFERHATSKIRNVTDLYALHTMGFRGEALPSIVAVAQVELKTRTAEEELGTRLLIEGSKIIEQEPIACPVGANFSVNNLFYNIPARRKFLKSNQTELNNILNEFERIALANPSVAMQLHNEGNCLLNLPAGKLRQRILGIFGKKLDKNLIPIHVDTTLAKLDGYIGTPESSRKKGAQQFFFVNGRYMRHPYFTRAVLSAYDRLIPEGENIPFFIHINVDPARIDVNIHPTKTEIKFEDDQEIWHIIVAAAREALGKFSSVPTIDFDVSFRPDIPAFSDNKHATIPSVKIDTGYNPFDHPSVPQSYRTPNSGASQWNELYDALQQSPVTSANSHDEETTPQNVPDSLFEDTETDWESVDTDFIQFKGRFLITSVKSGLMLIDQHRAHVRILYENYKRNIEEQHGLSQGVLFPQMMQLSPSQAKLLTDVMDQLKYIGFDLTPMGGGSYAINGVPSGTEGLDPVQLLLNIIEEISQGSNKKLGDEIYHTIAFAMAKKVAVPIGQVIGEKEIKALVEQLFACETPNYTPDGKTVIVIIPQDNINRLFG